MSGLIPWDSDTSSCLFIIDSRLDDHFLDNWDHSDFHFHSSSVPSHITMHPSNRVSSPKPGTVRKSVMSRLKSQTLPSELSTSSEEVEFLPYLSYITDGCVILDIDPSACKPLHLLRFRIDNAVQKLKAILNGNFNHHFGGPNLTGMVSGAPTSIVVPLTGESKS